MRADVNHPCTFYPEHIASSSSVFYSCHSFFHPDVFNTFRSVRSEPAGIPVKPDKGASRCLSQFITFQTLPIGLQRAGCCFSEECRRVDIEKEIPCIFPPPPSLAPTAGMLGGGLPVKCSHHRSTPTQCSSSLTATATNALNLICKPVHVLVWLTACVLSVRNGIHQPLAPVGDPHFPNLDRPVSP